MSGIQQAMMAGGYTLDAYLPASMDPHTNGAAPSLQSATITVASDGSYTVDADGTTPTGDDAGTWMIQGTNSDFQVRMTGTGDSPGTLNTWLALNISRSWNLQISSSGSYTFTGTLELRRSADSVVVASSSVSMFVFDL